MSHAKITSIRAKLFPELPGDSPVAVRADELRHLLAAVDLLTESLDALAQEPGEGHGDIPGIVARGKKLLG